jgi:hypothetical protein
MKTLLIALAVASLTLAAGADPGFHACGSTLAECIDHYGTAYLVGTSHERLATIDYEACDVYAFDDLGGNGTQITVYVLRQDVVVPGKREGHTSFDVPEGNYTRSDMWYAVGPLKAGTVCMAMYLMH